VVFHYQPPLTSRLADPALHAKVGDIRQPWVDLSTRCGMSEFSAKAFFATAMMLQFVESANAVLHHMRFRGFLSAFELMASAIELLGRCTHPDIGVRQHPTQRSGDRLQAGLKLVKVDRLPPDVIVETNHFPASQGGYSVQDLQTLRNFTTHGACIDASTGVKADIELLHEVRKAFFGVVHGEDDPHSGPGPIPGAIDRYLGSLLAGDVDLCDHLASAALSPAPLSLHAGGWRFADQLVDAMQRRVDDNLARGFPAVSGGYAKTEDHFQLYR
jgi:hypothetical protein